MNTLYILNSIYQDILDHAKSIAPIESCGYLAGKNAIVTQFYPMTNVDNSEEHFSFDPKEQFNVVKDARKQGLSLLSVYHSHPASPARLSEEDIRLFNDPNTIYIIVSLIEDEPTVAGFQIKKEDNRSIQITKINIETTDEKTT